MFIITGSMIRQAISSPRSASSAPSASASLKGTTALHASMPAGMPRPIGMGSGTGPSFSASGMTENITASWCPWYEPSILATTSRPVAPRASRTASMVASVPELVKRTRSRRKRRQSSSAIPTVSSVDTAKCVPRLATRAIASATFGCACPTAMVPKPLW
jgi:hypothetical protein